MEGDYSLEVLTLSLKCSEPPDANCQSRIADQIKSEENLSKVSVVGVGMRSHAGVALKMFEIFAQENIHIHLISTSEIKISCVIDAKYAELAVRSLHDGFDLSHA